MKRPNQLNIYILNSVWLFAAGRYSLMHCGTSHFCFSVPYTPTRMRCVNRQSKLALSRHSFHKSSNEKKQINASDDEETHEVTLKSADVT